MSIMALKLHNRYRFIMRKSSAHPFILIHPSIHPMASEYTTDPGHREALAIERWQVIIIFLKEVHCKGSKESQYD